MGHIRMKICILIDGISNSGGTDRVASIISNLFTENGLEVKIYTLSEGEPYYFLDNRVGVISPKYRSRFINLIYFCNHIKKNSYDIIIVLSMGRLSAQAIPLLKFFNVKSRVICNDHVSIESFSKVVQLVKWPAYLLSNKVVVLTESDRSYLSKRLNEKVCVVRNCSPYEHETIENGDINKKNKIALAVGRLTYQKNFQRLLKIWGEVETLGWELVIVGSGEDQKEIEGIISGEKLNNVKIQTPNKNLKSWYEKSAMLLMTSRYEGLPMVLIEAKNFALPVISFDCNTGPREIIKDDGFIINYDDDDEFKARLIQLMSDDKLRFEMSRNALKNSTLFSEKEILNEWLLAFK